MYLPYKHCEFFFFQLGREVLDEAYKAVAVGVTTEEIDQIVHEVRKNIQNHIKYIYIIFW